MTITYRDPDKIPDAPHDRIAYAGIEVWSRYSKRDEFEAMMKAIDYVLEKAPGYCGMVTTLFCDSKASCCYAIQAVDGNGTVSLDDAQCLADWFALAFYETSGGHNGVTVESPPNVTAAAEPNWNFGDLTDDPAP